MYAKYKLVINKLKKYVLKEILLTTDDMPTICACGKNKTCQCPNEPKENNS